MSDLAATNCGCDDRGGCGCGCGCGDNNNNSGFFGCGNNCCSILWIIILLAFCGNGKHNMGFGGGGDCCWIIIVLLLLCCGNGFGNDCDCRC